MRVWCFQVEFRGLGFRVLGCRVLGFSLEVWGFRGFGVQGLGLGLKMYHISGFCKGGRLRALEGFSSLGFDRFQVSVPCCTFSFWVPSCS